MQGQDDGRSRPPSVVVLRWKADTLLHNLVNHASIVDLDTSLLPSQVSDQDFELENETLKLLGAIRAFEYDYVPDMIPLDLQWPFLVMSRRSLFCKSDASLDLVSRD